MKFLIVFLGFFSSIFSHELDKRIEKLHREIKELRLKALQEEVGSSYVMRSDDAEFAADIEQAESYEDQVARKEKELDELIQQRNAR